MLSPISRKKNCQLFSASSILVENEFLSVFTMRRKLTVRVRLSHRTLSGEYFWKEREGSTIGQREKVSLSGASADATGSPGGAMTPQHCAELGCRESPISVTVGTPLQLRRL